MAREFSVGTDGATVANAPFTAVFINPTAAPNPTLYVMRFWWSQSGTAVSAQQRIQVEQQVSVFPTLVGATPRALKRSDGTASIIVSGTAGAQGTAGVNASAEGAGAKTVLWGDNVNNLNGYLWTPGTSELLEAPPALVGGIGLFLPAAPSNTGNHAMGINYKEGL